MFFVHLNRCEPPGSFHRAARIGWSANSPGQRVTDRVATAEVGGAGGDRTWTTQDEPLKGERLVQPGCTAWSW